METITAQEVTKFAVRARRINILTKAQKELHEKIYGKLLAGASLPTDGPHVIDLSQNGGKEFSWEEQYEKILIMRYRNKGQTKTAAVAMAKEKMKKMKEAAPDKDGPTIDGKTYVGGVKFLPKINDKYRKEAA